MNNEKFFHVSLNNFKNFELGHSQNHSCLEGHENGIWFSNSIRETLQYKNSKSEYILYLTDGTCFICSDFDLIRKNYNEESICFVIDNNVFIDAYYLRQANDLEHGTLFEFNNAIHVKIDVNEIVRDEYKNFIQIVTDRTNYLYQVDLSNLKIFNVESNYKSVIGNFPTEKEIMKIKELGYDGIRIKGYNYAYAVRQYCSTMYESEIEYYEMLQEIEIQKNMVKNHCNMFIWNCDNIIIDKIKKIKQMYI